MTIPDDPIVLVDVSPTWSFEERVARYEQLVPSLAATRDRLMEERAKVTDELEMTDMALGLVGDRADLYTKRYADADSRLKDADVLLGGMSDTLTKAQIFDVIRTARARIRNEELPLDTPKAEAKSE